MRVWCVGFPVSFFPSLEFRRSHHDGGLLSKSRLAAKLLAKIGNADYKASPGGMLVAFFWTFFPYPLTARSKLRHDLGASLYLLANFYSCIHTTISMRLSGTEGNLDDNTSPGYKLYKARTKVFSKELALLTELREGSA